MTRGMFNFLQNEPPYTGADKDWYVELSHSTCFWYDLLLHPPEGFDTKKQITDYLKNLKSMVESQQDKRFIYFLAARKKIRFCVSKKPSYSWFGDELIFYVEMGRQKIKRKLTTRILDAATHQAIKPPVEVSDRFITFYFSPENKVSLPIHDFLQSSGIELGINMEVHYIGYTKNPSGRPINGAHRGLSDMLYRISNEEHDFFVFYNIFKVLSISSGKSSPINFCVANSMIDEIKVDEEGRLIEAALIKYFGTETQEANKKNEEAELENTLERLATKNKINSVAVKFEMNEPSELYRLFSRSVKASDKHVFTCRIGSNGVEITQGANFGMSIF